MRARTPRLVAAGALAAAVLLTSVEGASASFHLIKIREVFPGTVANPDSDYVELQAYAAGQNQVNIGTLRVYNADGTATHDITPGAVVANGADQMTVVMGDSQTNTVFGITADDTNSGLNLDPAAGAACWPQNFPSTADCVSWGAFTGNAMLPSTAGTPVSGTGITNGQAIRRSIALGCSTLLQDSQDDTNDSQANFAEVAPAPRINSAPITETPCVLNVGITGSGTVNGGGINCPGTCTQTYANGQLVILSPIATNGASFVNWTGDTCGMGIGNTCTLDMHFSRSVTANFTAGNPPTMNPPTLTPTPLIPTTPAAAAPTAPKKCKKGFVKRKGKCRKKRK